MVPFDHLQVAQELEVLGRVVDQLDHVVAYEGLVKGLADLGGHDTLGEDAPDVGFFAVGLVPSGQVVSAIEELDDLLSWPFLQAGKVELFIIR